MKIRTTFILSLTVILPLAAGSAFGKYSGGTGEPNTPYQIATKADLLALAANTGDYSKCFILTADVNIQGQVFTTAIIASGPAFTGTFDGNGHKITNFTINGRDDVGLFGYIDSGGNVKNIGLENFSVSGDSNSEEVGGLVGYNWYGSISNCYSTGSVSGSGSSDVGGLVGYNYWGSISNCYSTGMVSGDSNSQVGGLVGYNEGTISDCNSTSSVSGGSNSGVGNVGGLVGWLEAGNVSNCYSTGDVTGGDNEVWLGGLVGENDGNISNCYSTGSVSGFNTVGGLMGYSDGSISNCYSTGTVSGYYEVGGLVGYSDGNISNCYSTGTVSSDSNSNSDSVGGLVGYNDSNISNCYSTGLVSGSSNSQEVGGLVGENDSNISNCYSMGLVSGGSNSQEVGGLVGDNESGGISNCYSTGLVSGGSGSDSVGGLVGDNGGSISNCYSTSTVIGGDGSAYLGGIVGYSDGNISNCYSTGTVSSDSNSDSVGGLVGYNNGSVLGSFWDINTSGQTTSDGGTSKTTAQMKTESTFTTTGWDFTNETTNGTSDYWRMCVDGVDYPRLSWQSPDGDLACPDGVDFVDFAYFAGWWHTTGCNSSNNFCGGADMDFSGKVDMDDLEIFAANWLNGYRVCPAYVNFVHFAYLAERWHTTGCNSSNNFCGGADMNASGAVDMQDLAILAANWLSGE